MDRYDPEITPDAKAWLGLEETEQQRLVERYHRKTKTPLPNLAIHAVIHVLVETQLALREPPNVVTTFERLMFDGLSRHEAIHAIGSVNSEHLFRALQDGTEPSLDNYAADLNKLTADSWLAEYGDDEDDDAEFEDDEE